MKILRTIDAYNCVSRALVVSQRCNFLGCIMKDNKYELHEFNSTMELIEFLNSGEKVFSVLHGNLKILNGDNALKHWTTKQIEIFNATIRNN